MATIEIKNKEKSDTYEILTQIKKLQTSVNRLQDIMKELVKKHNIDMDDISPIIATAFDDVDFIKQVCYRNKIHSNVIELVIVYEHDDYNFAMDTIFERFGKLQDQLADLELEMIYCRTSQIKQNFMENTTSVFKREK